MGPMAPATKRGLLGSIAVYLSQASLASRAEARFISRARWLHSCSACAMLVAEKVFVSTMSAPASRYCSWIFRMASGRESESSSLLPLSRILWSSMPFGWKSASVRPSFWIMVPMAPSRTRMRCWAMRSRSVISVRISVPSGRSVQGEGERVKRCEGTLAYPRTLSLFHSLTLFPALQKEKPHPMDRMRHHCSLRSIAS